MKMMDENSAPGFYAQYDHWGNATPVWWDGEAWQPNVGGAEEYRSNVLQHGFDLVPWWLSFWMIRKENAAMGLPTHRPHVSLKTRWHRIQRAMN